MMRMPTILSLRPVFIPWICVLWICTLCSSSVVFAERDTAQAFRQSNPDYRERAGKFYEKDYLPGAIKGLQTVFAPQQLDTNDARMILTDLIYDFLDHYIADGGSITRRHHAEVLVKLDAAIHRMIDDPAIGRRYERWKADKVVGLTNPLSFLTNPERQSPPVELKLPPSLQKIGWRVQSLTSVKKTGEYADVLGMEPYQVFVFHHRVEDGDLSRRAMTLLLFRLKHAPQLLAHVEQASKTRAINPRNQNMPQLFWQTKNHVVFLQENRSSRLNQDSLTLKRSIRRQWTGK